MILRRNPIKKLFSRTCPSQYVATMSSWSQAIAVTQTKHQACPIFIFIGAPGVGKGTFATLVSEALSLKHLDMGKLLRNEVKSGSDFGISLKNYLSIGELVPDELVNRLLLQAIKSNINCSTNNGNASYISRDSYKGILLDGYPRNLEQAKYLDSTLTSIMKTNININAINISLEKWVAVEKCLGRRVCKTCLKGFNTAHIIEKGFDMPAISPDPTTCNFKPECVPVLEKRDDDDIEIITKRFESFRLQTKPLLDYYEKKGSLKSFEVKRGIKDTKLLVDLMQS